MSSPGNSRAQSSTSRSCIRWCLKGIEATVTPPTYTNRAAEVVKEGNFRAIEGSRVQLNVVLDRVPKTAALVLGGPSDSSRESIPLQIDGPRLTGELPPITKELRYEIDAADGGGMKLESESYRIKVLTDDKPTIRFIQPRGIAGGHADRRGSDRGRSDRRFRPVPPGDRL